MYIYIYFTAYLLTDLRMNLSGWFQGEGDAYASHDASVLSAHHSMLYDTNQQTKEDLVKEILKHQLLVLDNNETRL